MKRASITTTIKTMTAATIWPRMSPCVTPSTSPNSRVVASVEHGWASSLLVMERAVETLNRLSRTRAGEAAADCACCGTSTICTHCCRSGAAAAYFKQCSTRTFTGPETLLRSDMWAAGKPDNGGTCDIEERCAVLARVARSFLRFGNSAPHHYWGLYFFRTLRLRQQCAYSVEPAPFR